MVMKKNNIILTVCIAVAMTFSLPSQAQRLIPKQRGIEVVGSVPLIKGEKFLAADNFGMGALLTRYLGRENYTFVMAEYEQQNMLYRSYNVKLKDAFLQVGYMHPVLSDRGKNVFLYGGAVHGSVEVFLTDRVLFLVKAQGRFLFGTDVHRFRPAISAGLRFNF